MAPQPFEGFHSSLKNYFNHDTLSDAVVCYNGQEFKVHRLILSAHSKCFTKQLDGPWKESSEKVIKIEDFDASVVEAMLHFMYNFDFTNVSATSTMVFDAQVYQIADKYDIPALKAHAKDKFGTAINTGWSMDDFSLAITVVYNSTPPRDRGLRDLVVETSHENIDTLIGQDGFCEVLRATTDFAADLVPFLCGKQVETTQSYKYPSCARVVHFDFIGGQHYCPKCGGSRSNWNVYQASC
ncbi:BTB/POZ protein [Dactylonectria macrodidyma]|uniref:BTB/POZ protein n=1 Tax=Dactylonectria macrodidyma TaxID=307937 RepID=A0A9P9DEC1_9HYPO|nr:BTB/POZ protein [Dactylonectria macrodidyma]